MTESRDYHLKTLFIEGLKGNSESYRAFLTELYQFVLPIIRAKSPDGYDDITQEVVMSVHDARHTFDFDRPIVPWIYAILNFRLNDHKRDYWRQRARLNAAAENFVESTDEKSNLGNELSEAINSLPTNQKDVVVMLKVEGFSLNEVAQKLGITVAAVKNRASRAYDGLRAFLSEDQNGS